jgi:predicted KAP-like P-loop ATPase
VLGTAPKFTLLGDQPHSGEEDPLGFHELAESLAQLILASRRSTPFTLGIEAGWGMGKSTLMARLRERLAREGETAKVTTIEFNAWTADETGVPGGL